MSDVRYMWEAGRTRRVMHLGERHPVSGDIVGALCRIGLPFDRTINAPFGLGRPICKNCKREAGLR